jgi:hypothetical protein
MMELVSITKVRPGQVIATAVTNAEGTVLCPPGFRLTEEAIEWLRRAGVESVVLEASTQGLARVQRRLDELQERFKEVDDPILLQMKAAIEKRFQFMLMEDGG